MVERRLGYREKLVRLLREKTGEEPDLDRIRRTVDRWVSRMAEDAAGASWEEIGARVPVEMLVPRKEGDPIPVGLWSVEELERMECGSGRRAEDDPRGRSKWIAAHILGGGLSPVDIHTSRAAKHFLWPLQFRDLFLDGEVRLFNDGHYMRVTTSWPAYLMDGPVFCEYQFDELHFHWSDDSNAGTNHSIDGKRFALEANFVFKYPSCQGYQKAVRRKAFDCVVVVILFQETRWAPFYQTFSYCNQVTQAGKEILVSGNILKDFLQALSRPEYYNYAGSINSAPSSENVSVAVMKQILPIHINQETRWAPFYQTFSYCNQVTQAGKEILVSGNILKDFLQALSRPEYYNYAGSINSAPSRKYICMEP